MLVLDMLREPTLESLWNQWDLWASAASWMATYATTKDAERRVEFMNVLQELHRMNATATEEGFAHALQQQMSTTMMDGDNNGDDDDDNPEASLVRLLEQVMEVPMEEDDLPVLPPRVALDHADRQLRLGAISTLSASVSNNENPSAAVELLETFVRRWSVEDDLEVLEALANAISPLLPTQGKLLNTGLVMKGLYRTMEIAPTKSDKNVLVALKMLRIASPTPSKFSLYEASLGFLLSKNKSIAKEARVLACDHLGLPYSVSTDLLTSNILEKAMPFLVHIQQAMMVGSKSQVISGQTLIQKQCSHNLLLMFADNEKSISTSQQANFVLELAASYVSSSGSRADKDQILKCLKDIAPLLSSNECRESSIVTMGLLSETAFQQIGIPTLESILECSRHSPVSILLETALNPSFPITLRSRTISLASEYAQKSTSPLQALPGIIPALMMLEDDDASIRSSALSFLVDSAKHFTESGVAWSDCHKMNVLEQFFKELSILEATNGFEPLVTLLPRLSTSQSVQTGLMHLCKLTARLDIPLSIDLVPVDQSPFTLGAVANFLGVLDLIGNESFALVDRWEIFGSRFVDTICRTESSSLVERYNEVIKRVVKMMRGRFVAQSQSSSGPRSGGGRTRSYSLGSVDDVQTVAEYPDGMKESILNILKSRNAGGIALTSEILQTLFMDERWSRNILHKMDAKSRVEAFASIARIVEEDCCDTATSLYLQLPFAKRDLQEHFENCLSAEPFNLSPMTSAARFLLSNVEKLAKADQDSQLLEKTFASLVTLFDSRSKHEKASYEYTCYSLISALDQLCRNSALPSTPGPFVVSSFQLLLKSQAKDSDALLSSSKYRLSALRLTATLADSYPIKGLPVLIDCFEAAAADNIFSALGHKHSFDLLRKILAAVWKHNSDGHFTRVLKIVATQSPIEEVDAHRNLLTDVVPSLSSVSLELLDTESRIFSAVGSLVSVSIALEWSSQNDREMALQAFRSTPKVSKMPSVLLVSTYMKNLILTLTGHDGVEDDIPSPLPSHMEVASLITHTELQKAELLKAGQARHGILGFLLALARELHKSLQTNDIHRLVRKGTGNEAQCCLSLWQTSLWLHAVTQQHESKLVEETNLWEALANQLGEIRDELQSTMPLTLFIASVSAMLDENPGSKALTEALELVAERVIDVHSSSPEAALFLSLVPNLEKSIDVASTWTSSSTESCQTTLMAIEHIGKMLFLANASTEMSKTDHEPFVAVLKRIEKLLNERASKFDPQNKSFDEMLPAHRDLICSISLTVATLTKMVGQKALPYIPKILKPLVNILSMANSEAQRQIPETKALQVAIVRAMMAFAESVPSSLGPHLQSLLSENILFSLGLRDQEDRILQQAVSLLDNTLAVKIPGRLLLPSLLAAIGKVTSNALISIYLVMLLRSIESMTSREAAAMRNMIFACVTKAMDVSGSLALDQNVLLGSKDVILALVMKLSEGQLRQFFTSLRDWKNSSTSEPHESNAPRREAFWFISAALAEKLRSLFLPCLSSVVDDVSSELQHGVALLCRKHFDKGGSGRKKRKLASPDDPPYKGCARIQSFVLLTLERSLQADARSGGNWVRVEEGARYNMILEPVAKLFHADLTAAVDENDPNYENFVEGVGSFDGGSVTGCLTALAVAAGDEQLWKPLNHAILEAAGSEGRSEVRLAGLNCLLGLIKSLGEEYMVLIPECLPVLSELLEDSSEEVAGVARDILTMAEDLLGESLEEAIR